MNITCKLEPTGARIFDRQLRAFSHDVKAYQKHARKFGGYVRSAALANLRKQRTVDGGPFASRAVERSRHRAKRRLLQGLADPVTKGRELAVVSNAGQGGGVAVTWKNGMTAQIAYQQQHGTAGKRMDPEAVKRERGNKSPSFDSPCTRDQAKALIREGFRLMVPAPGGGRGPGRNKFPKRVSVRWLEDHFSIGQAGLILRLLQTEKLTGKKSWETGIPARPFLGVTDAQAEQYSERFARSLAKAVEKAGR